jgi:multidrug efflux system outer membrane protein
MRRSILAIAALAGLAGCAVGPKYERPAIETPTTFRGGPSAEAELSNWKQIFQDEPLRVLLAEALQNNYDVRAAAPRILDAIARIRNEKSLH